MLLGKLSEAMGPSGFEDEIRNVIREEIRTYVNSVETDVLGNLLAYQPAKKSGPTVMLDAHMDEVGLMIVEVCDGSNDGGLLKFRPLGGIDPRVLVSKPVRIGAHKVPGVIGAKPKHLQTADEGKHPIPMDRLYIDIGASDANDAKELVKPGDVAVFATRYGEMGARCAKGKSFDDRVGCGLLIESLKETYDMPVVAAFTVQEEIGTRGARAAAYRVQPDIAIALEGTVCFDVVGAMSHGESTVMGKGPALTVQDSRTVADRRFLEFMMEVAKAADIPYQLRRVKGGSNDFSAIHQAGPGVTGGSISIPVRYIHAPVQVISLDDYANALRLLNAVLRAIDQGRFSV